MEALKITEEIIGENAFEHKKRKPGVNYYNAGLGAGPSNNWTQVDFPIYYSGAPRAKRPSGAPWVNKSTYPRKFGNHSVFT